MDIINVVHLFTFYSAIWENEGSTANGKCAYFGTLVSERVPIDVHGIGGGRGDSRLTSPKWWSRVGKLGLRRGEDFWISLRVYSGERASAGWTGKNLSERSFAIWTHPSPRPVCVIAEVCSSCQHVCTPHTVLCDPIRPRQLVKFDKVEQVSEQMAR